MNKAILVIDMPEGCNDCPLMFRHEEERCCIPERRNSFSKKPSWCPLKELPEKYNIEEEKKKRHDRFYEWEFEGGYNACIDEILEA